VKAKHSADKERCGKKQEHKDERDVGVGLVCVRDDEYAYFYDGRNGISEGELYVSSCSRLFE